MYNLESCFDKTSDSVVYRLSPVCRNVPHFLLLQFQRLLFIYLIFFLKIYYFKNNIIQILHILHHNARCQ